MNDLINPLSCHLKAHGLLKTDKVDKQLGMLIYHLATKSKAQIKNHLNYLVENICNKNLKSELQLDGKISPFSQ